MTMYKSVNNELVEMTADEIEALDAERAQNVTLAASRGVNAERARRILAGKSFAIAGYADPIMVAGDDTTQLNLLALKDTARDLKAAAVTDAVIPFRDAQNALHMLTADQMIELVDAGKQQVQAIYSASWALKAMDPIPADYADDGYWAE